MSESQNPYQAPLQEIEPQPEEPQDIKETLIAVGRAQRLVNIGILLYLLLMVGTIIYGRFVSPNSIAAEFYPILITLILFVVLMFEVYAVARLAYALHGVGNAIIYSAAMLIPCMGLMLLLFLSSRATQLLRRHEIKVGLLGANPDSLRSVVG